MTLDPTRVDQDIDVVQIEIDGVQHEASFIDLARHAAHPCYHVTEGVVRLEVRRRFGPC